MYFNFGMVGIIYFHIFDIYNLLAESLLSFVNEFLSLD